MSFDNAELRAFAIHLDGAPKVVRREARAVVKKGATNIKTQLREEMGRSEHFKQIVPKINYDVTEVGVDGGGIIEAEIGAAAEGAGLLENLAYFGGANGGGGTVPDPLGALIDELPKFEKAIADIAADAI